MHSVLECREHQIMRANYYLLSPHSNNMLTYRTLFDGIPVKISFVGAKVTQYIAFTRRPYALILKRYDHTCHILPSAAPVHMSLRSPSVDGGTIVPVDFPPFQYGISLENVYFKSNKILLCFGRRGYDSLGSYPEQWRIYGGFHGVCLPPPQTMM